MKTNLLKSMLIVAFAFVAQFALAETIVITGDNVRLRMQPSTKANTLIYTATGKNVHVNKGDAFECYGHKNGFCKIYYDGNEVWVSTQYTSHATASSTTKKTTSSGTAAKAKGYHPDWITVQGDGVRLRKTASMKGEVAGSVNKGTQLRCIGASGNFWQVNYKGDYLYISKDFAF
ncbi:MAG: hypothetical protein HUK08_02335 [Bacteroidaceae bacterium]|nr:hypothetical protein [Bacteroidaceae bacterium]